MRVSALGTDRADLPPFTVVAEVGQGFFSLRTSLVREHLKSLFLCRPLPVHERPWPTTWGVTSRLFPSCRSRHATRLLISLATHKGPSQDCTLCSSFLSLLCILSCFFSPCLFIFFIFLSCNRPETPNWKDVFKASVVVVAQQFLHLRCSEGWLRTTRRNLRKFRFLSFTRRLMAVSFFHTVRTGRMESWSRYLPRSQAIPLPTKAPTLPLTWKQI